MSALAHAVALIKRHEGCRLRAYLCPAGVWTIGWGSTGPGIREGVTWTQAQADERLATDVKRFMDGVRSAIKRPASDNELGAMTSLAYNIGAKAFRASTLLRLFNQGRKAEAAKQFDRWNKSNGVVLNGLIKRRADERRVFEQAAEVDEVTP